MLVTDGRSSFGIVLYDNPTLFNNVLVPAQVGLNAGDRRRYINIPAAVLQQEHIIRIDGIHVCNSYSLLEL